MKMTTVRNIYKNSEKYIDKELTIGGWVRSNRDSKSFGFLVISDGSYFEQIQVVYNDKLSDFDKLTKINVGAALIITGTLVATPQAKQPFEIQASKIEIEGESNPDYPLQKKRHTLEYLRTISHLRQYLESDPLLPMQYINSFRKEILYTCIHQLLQAVMLRAQEKCLELPPLSP